MYIKQQTGPHDRLWEPPNDTKYTTTSFFFKTAYRLFVEKRRMTRPLLLSAALMLGGQDGQPLEYLFEGENSRVLRPRESTLIVRERSRALLQSRSHLMQ